MTVQPLTFVKRSISLILSVLLPLYWELLIFSLLLELQKKTTSIVRSFVCVGLFGRVLL